MKRIILIVSLCVCALGAVAADDAVFTAHVRPSIVTTKMYGMGGPNSAAVVGFDTLFSNPAALSRAGKRGMIGSVDAKLTGPLEDLLKMAMNGSFSGGSDKLVDDLLSLVEKNHGVNLAGDALGPIAFGFINNGFGFGIFNRSFVAADLPSVTKLKASVGEEIQLIFGWGFDLIDLDFLRLSAGVSVRGFAQVQTSYIGSPLNLLSSGGSINVPVWLTAGFGFDAGVLLSFGKFMNVGIMWKDIYTPAYTGSIGKIVSDNTGMSTEWHSPVFGAPYLFKSNLSAGVCFNLVEQEKGFVTSWKIMADYRDALSTFGKDIYRNPVLNISAGTELVLFNMISLRAGIYDMYFCAGAGLGFGPFKLDVALYTKELGLEPGDAPLMNLGVSIGFNY